jgi:two-component system, OmpR family, sensor kinase
MSLRGRLVLSFAYLLFLAVAALGVPLAVNIERRAQDELEARLASSGQVIASSVTDLLESDNRAGQLRKVVAEFGREVQADVEVTTKDGEIAASSGNVSSDVDISDRPEIAHVLGGASDGATTVGEGPEGDALFVAVPVVKEGEVIGAVRIMEDLSELDSTVLRSRLILGAVGGFVVIGGLAVAWALASSLARPLRNLANTAERLGSGDLGARAEEQGASDITAVAHAMNAMASEVSAGVEAQRDFVANASHQLRTPLTGLRIRLEAIAGDEGPAGKSAEAALKEVDRLAELVDDLLVLARTTARDTDPVAVDLSACTTDAVERWKPRARARSHEVNERVAASVEVCADPIDVSGVLDNLLENAIAYCPEGSRIDVEVGSMNGEARLVVKDNGPGISGDDKERVFERFYRGRVGRGAGPGSGLGLAIVREIAERWGGRAEIDSSAEGTRVFVSWPVAK